MAGLRVNSGEMLVRGVAVGATIHVQWVILVLGLLVARLTVHKHRIVHPRNRVGWIRPALNEERPGFVE